MKLNVYCMRDSMTGFLTPTFDYSDSTAIRNFSFAMNRKDTLFNANPKDYDLFCVGSFDSDTGKIEACVPRQVVQGVSVIETAHKKAKRV